NQPAANEFVSLRRPVPICIERPEQLLERLRAESPVLPASDHTTEIMPEASFPLPLQDEPGPVIRVLPACLPRHRKLRLPQGRGRAELLRTQHALVETLHEVRCGCVVHTPETRHDARRACVHEGARESHETLPSDLLAESCPAGRENNEICGEFE